MAEMHWGDRLESLSQPYPPPTASSKLHQLHDPQMTYGQVLDHVSWPDDPVDNALFGEKWLCAAV